MTEQLALSEILAVFDKPELQQVFTVSQWEDDYEAFTEAHSGLTAKVNLKTFVRGEVKTFLEAINLPFLQQVVGDLNKRISAEPPIEYASFTLSKDLPTYEEVQQTISQIHEQVARTAAYREECNHYTTVLKSAQDYLTSFRKTLETFLHDETIEPMAFEGLAARKRFAEPLTIDLEAYTTRVATLRATVTNLYDNILGQRQNLLMRSDSAVRMLVTKTEDADRHLNSFQSRRKTTTPTERDISDSGFEVERVGSQ